jgi:hypothetical protein
MQRWCRRMAAGMVVLLAVMTGLAHGQERRQGLSLHLLPKRVADMGGQPWGLTVDRSWRLKGEPPAIESAADLQRYFREQSESVQANGIWIVTTDPAAYGAEEMRLLEGVEAMCGREKIPLFVCRASQLPDGWKRVE